MYFMIYSFIRGENVMEYYSIGKFAKMIGKTPQTLRAWHKEGNLIPAHVTAGGTRYYSQEQLNHFLGFTKQKMVNRKVIGYCRVSSNKQKNDLIRQVDNVKTYMFAKGYQFEIIEDIGHGINYGNKGLNKLLDAITNYEVEKIVILYKDRLVCFGFELIETICHKYDCEIEIIDSTEKTENEELVEYLIQIITDFSCHSKNKRVHEAKNLIKSLVTEDDNI